MEAGVFNREARPIVLELYDYLGERVLASADGRWEIVVPLVVHPALKNRPASPGEPMHTLSAKLAPDDLGVVEDEIAIFTNHVTYRLEHGDCAYRGRACVKLDGPLVVLECVEPPFLCAS
jgi:hypothetical protein